MAELTIVTGSDQNYYSLLLELLESIHHTRFYKNIPIQILDCGLNQESKEKLFPYLNGGRIIDPGWFIKPKKISKFVWKTGRIQNLYPPFDHYKTVISKPYLDEIFKGFQYYLWISPNFWVQDDRALDQYIVLCEKQGYSASIISWEGCDDPFKKHVLSRYAKNYLDTQYLDTIQDMQHVCDAVFCAHIDFFRRWRALFEICSDVHDYFYYMTEETAMITMAQNKALEIVEPHWFGYAYIPVIYQKEPDLIYNLKTNFPIGLVKPINNLEGYNSRIYLFTKNNDKEIIKGSTRFWSG